MLRYKYEDAKSKYGGSNFAKKGMIRPNQFFMFSSTYLRLFLECVATDILFLSAYPLIIMAMLDCRADHPSKSITTIHIRNIKKRSTSSSVCLW